MTYVENITLTTAKHILFKHSWSPYQDGGHTVPKEQVQCTEKNENRAAEMLPLLTALAAIAEDWGLVSSTHVR